MCTSFPWDSLATYGYFCTSFALAQLYRGHLAQK